MNFLLKGVFLANYFDDDQWVPERKLSRYTFLIENERGSAMMGKSKCTTYINFGLIRGPQSKIEDWRTYYTICFV